MATAEDRNIVVFCDNDSNTVSFHLKDLVPKGRQNDLLGETLGSNYTLIHIGDAKIRRKKPKIRRTLDDSGGGSAATSPTSDPTSDVEEDPGIVYDSDSSDDSGADSDDVPTVSVMVERLPSDYIIPIDGEEKMTAVSVAPSPSGVAEPSPTALDTVSPTTPASGNDVWEFSAVNLVDDQDENSLVSSFGQDELIKLQSILRSEQAKQVLGAELPGVLGANAENRCRHAEPHSRADLLSAIWMDHCYTSKMLIHRRQQPILPVKMGGQDDSDGEEDEEGDDDADDDDSEDDDDFQLNEEQRLECAIATSTTARRSERQRERLEKEEVERIRAQNKQMLERERLLLKEKQLKQEEKEKQEPEEQSSPKQPQVLATPEVGRQSAGKVLAEERVKTPVDEKNDAEVSNIGSPDVSDAKRRLEVQKRAEVETTPAPPVTAGKKLRQTTLPFVPIDPSGPGPSTSCDATLQSSDSDQERRRASQRERKPTTKRTQSEEYLNIMANATLDRVEKKTLVVTVSDTDIASAASGGGGGGGGDSKRTSTRQSSGGKGSTDKPAKLSSDSDTDGNNKDSLRDSSGAPNDDGNKRHKKGSDDEVVLDDDEEGDGDDGDDENNEDENDPNKLWCVCRKPHNNRFMICCDKCEDWFHGTCVNITKAQGQKMEQAKKQWICPQCKKTSNSKTATPQPEGSVKTRRRSGRGGSEMSASPARATTPVPGKDAEKVPEVISAPSTPVPPADPPAEIVEKAEKRDKAEKAEKPEKVEKAENVEKAEKPKRKSKGVETATGRKTPEISLPAAASPAPSPSPAPPREGPRRCAAGGCVRPVVNPVHAYCSARCVYNAVDHYRRTFSKPSTTRIPVIDKKNDKILKGFEAPMLENLLSFLKKDLAYEIYIPSPQSAQPSVPPPVAEKKADTEGGAKPGSPKEESEAQPSKSTEGKGAKSPRKEPRGSYEYDPIWSPLEAPSSKKEGPDEQQPHALKRKPKPPVKIVAPTPRRAVMLTEVPPIPGSSANPLQIAVPLQKKSQGQQKQPPKKEKEELTGQRAPEDAPPPSAKKEPGNRKAEDRLSSSPPRKTAAVPDKKQGGKDKKPSPVTAPASGKKLPDTPAGDKSEKKPSTSSAEKKTEEAKKVERKNSTSSTISSSSSSTKKSGDSHKHGKSGDRHDSSSKQGEHKDDKEKRKDEKHKEAKRKEEKPKDEKHKDVVRKSSSSSKGGEMMKSPKGDDDPKKQGDDPRPVVKSKLAETFKSRFTDPSKELKEKMGSIASKIEKELWATHGTDLHKYKTKFRSLLFNLKDPKNDLHERILGGVIEPAKIVHMSANELAPKELALWRVQSEKHDLELIKKQEYENLRSGDVFVVKTHKGEVILEGEDGAATEKSREVSKQLEEEGSALETRSTPHAQEHDTTENHGKHAFDEKCKICVAEMKKMERDDQAREKERRNKRKHSSGDSEEEEKSKDDVKGDGKKKKEKGKHKHKKKRRHESTKDDVKPAELEVMSPSSAGSSASFLTSPTDAAKSVPKDSDDEESKKDQRKQDLERQLKMLKEKMLEMECQDKREQSIMEMRCLETVEEAEKTINSASGAGPSNEEGSNEGSQDRSSSGSATVNPLASVVGLKETRETETSSASTARSTLLVDDLDYSDKEEDERHRYAVCWEGHVVIPDPGGTADLKVEAYPLSGFCDHLFEDIELSLQVVGRVAPNSVYSYFEDMRKRGNKEMVIARLHPKRGIDRVHNGRTYARVFKMLSEKQRFGVLEPHATCVKDLYLVPLGKDALIPEQFQPLQGPGLERNRQDMLLFVLWRKKRERTEKHNRRWLRPGDDSRSSMSPIDIDSVIPVARSFTPPLPELLHHHRPHHSQSQDRHQHHPHHRSNSQEERAKPALDRSSPYEPGEGFSDDDRPRTPPLPGLSSFKPHLPLPPFTSQKFAAKDSTQHEIVAVSDSSDEETVSPAKKMVADPIVQRYAKASVVDIDIATDSESENEEAKIHEDIRVVHESPKKGEKEQKRLDRWDQRPEDVPQKDPRLGDSRRRQDLGASSASSSSASSITQSPSVIYPASSPAPGAPSPSPSSLGATLAVPYPPPPPPHTIPLPASAPPPLPASAPPPFMPPSSVVPGMENAFGGPPTGFMQQPVGVPYPPPHMAQAMNVQPGFMPYGMAQPQSFMHGPHPGMGPVNPMSMQQMPPHGPPHGPRFWHGPQPGMPGGMGMSAGLEGGPGQSDLNMHPNAGFNNEGPMGMQQGGNRHNWDAGRINRQHSQQWNRGPRDRQRDHDRGRDRGRDRDRNQRRWDESSPAGRNRDRDRSRERSRGRDRPHDRDRDRRRSRGHSSREPEELQQHPGAEEGEIID